MYVCMYVCISMIVYKSVCMFADSRGRNLLTFKFKLFFLLFFFLVLSFIIVMYTTYYINDPLRKLIITLNPSSTH